MKPFTNEILPQGYKMTELGALPEEWEVVVFEKCIKNEASKVGKVKQQEYKVYGKYPIIDQGQSLIAGYCDNEKYVYEGRLPVIIFGDHTRILKFINFPFVTGADGTKVLIPNTSVILPEFFYFALLNIKIPNRGYNRHYSLLREQKLPPPPTPRAEKDCHCAFCDAGSKGENPGGDRRHKSPQKIHDEAPVHLRTRAARGNRKCSAQRN